jgi:hypothetical protein
MARNEWSPVPIPDPLNLFEYTAWLGDGLLLWGGYVDTTDPNQCTNVPEGVGCDPASSYEPILDGKLFHLDCATE